LEDKAKVKIPAGTQSGHEFRLKGKGMPAVGSRSKGEQIVHISIDVPRKLNNEQKELLRQFEEMTGSGASKSFMEKFKEMFSATEK
jgi:molecular chaperone DnaJ